MNFNLTILTPTTGFNRSGYTYSLVNLMTYFANNRIYPECSQQSLDYHIIEGSGISANREQLVVDALKTNCTHILFIDEDMGFVPQTLHVLASKRQRIVGTNYPMRGKGSSFTALTEDRQARVVTGPHSVGLAPVFYTGFGFCLIERSVFEQMKRPWFLIGYNTDNYRYTTEDAAFGNQLHELGIPWYVDHDASKLICHIGNYNYQWQEAYESIVSIEKGKTNGNIT